MCIFCRIIAGELPASVVYEDAKAVAFLDIQPITPGHVLVVPKTHAASLIDLSQEDAAEMMRVGQIIDRALQKSTLRCEGVNLFLADGRAAGQEVDHVHLHVFPRFKGDGFEMQFNSSTKKQPGRTQLDEDAKRIKAALNPDV
jgi:histidine triad (HIT) family protein